MWISVRSGIFGDRNYMLVTSLWSLWALHYWLCGGEPLDCRLGGSAIIVCGFTFCAALGLLSTMV